MGIVDAAICRKGPIVVLGWGSEQAIELYVEGSSLSAIGRLLGYSTTAVQGWVKKGGAKP